MDLLLIMTYAAICIGIFKVFKIPLNKWTVPTAILGGIIIIGTLIFLMNYNHPYSEAAREYYVTTPIIPSVSGRVIEVPVAPNTPLQAGDVLFRLDSIPFENKVKDLQARLVSATQDLERAKSLLKSGAGIARNVDLAQASVDSLTAQLDDAQYNLDQSTVRAPTAGFVTQVYLQPGMYAMAMPLRPVMVFVHKDENAYVGWFRQNYMLRLVPGDEAEVAFDGIPGEVFSAVVIGPLPVLAEGQIQASGTLVDTVMGQTVRAGRIPVVLRITDPKFDTYRNQVPMGSYGQAAIYSKHMHHVAIMRKILLRMAAWMNYIFPFH